MEKDRVDRSNLENWVASYAGCDGGNPDKSKIWLVGLEWGYAKKNKGQSDTEHKESVRSYYAKEMIPEINGLKPNTSNDTFKLSDNIDYTFGRNTAKLITAIRGEKVESFYDFVQKVPDTEVSKLNLYPIAIPENNDSAWNQYNLDEITGLPTKQDYRDLCAQYRFPFFKKELSKRSPHIILCLGTSHLAEFTQCFCQLDSTKSLKYKTFQGESDSNKRNRYIYWHWINDNTLFVTTPFVMWASGLNSDYLLQEVGNHINQLLSNK